MIFVRSAIFAALLFGSPLAAETPRVLVHDIGSQVQCDTYRSFWGLWLVTECQNRFSAIRDGIESALIESDAFAVVDPLSASQSSATYDVYGTVTGLGVQNRKTSDTDYCISASQVLAAVDIRVIDRASGTIVFGGNIQKSVDQESHISAGRNDRCHLERGKPLYEIVQRELSLAVARSIVFRVQPLAVSAVDENRVVINRGKPLLVLGSIIKVADVKGFPRQYRVIGTMGKQSIAEPIGNATAIPIGALAEYVESDDNEANARRFQKADLP